MKRQTSSNGLPNTQLEAGNVKKERGNFSIRLEAMILERGWSQSELGREAGLARHLISKYVNGLAEPKKLNLLKLARALGVSPGALMAEHAIPGFYPAAPATQYSGLSPSTNACELLPNNQARLRIDAILQQELALRIFTEVCEAKKGDPSA